MGSKSSATFCGPPLCGAAQGGVQIEPITTSTVSRKTSRTTTSSRTSARPLDNTPTRSSSSESTMKPTASATILTPTLTSTDGEAYFTYYVYQEPLITKGITSWTSTKIPQSVFDNWMKGMSTAIPSTALSGYNNAPDFIDAVNSDIQGKHPPKWLKTVDSDAQSVLPSSWIPRHDSNNTATTPAPLSEYDRMFPPEIQAHMLNLNETSNTDSDKKPISHTIAVGISVPFAAVLIFIAIYLILRIRSHRRQQHDEEHTQSPFRKNKNLKSPLHKRDYNAEPLFPHKPLARLSETSFTTEPGPSCGSISKNRASEDLPNLLELQGSPTEATELLAEQRPSSSDDDFGAHFSGLEDPFYNDHNAPAELPSPSPARVAMTPGVSPSTYPLRDRVSQESGRRREAIDSTASPSGRRRRRSVGEGELRELGRAFHLSQQPETDGGGKELRESKSMDDVGKVEKEVNREARWSGSGRESPSSVNSSGGRNVDEAVLKLMSSRHK